MSIQNLINTGGWKEAEKMFNKAIQDCLDPSNIDAGSSNESIAREVRARVIAAGIITQVISNIKLAGGGDPVKKISYK